MVERSRSEPSVRLICGDVLDVLNRLGQFECCFMDPPDAIGLKGHGYKERPKDGYISWLGEVVRRALSHCDILWVSYNAIWDLPFKYWLHAYLKRSDVEIKPFVWTFTFGQNRETDCGSGFRPLLRFRREGAPLYPEQIKVASWRQLNGDKRAAKGGRVPLDCWDFPRVVGNAKQRRAWHPTQHPEKLVERAILLSTKEGDSVLDLFSGTGTVLRACKGKKRRITSVELNPYYCKKIAREHHIPRLDENTWEGG